MLSTILETTTVRPICPGFVQSTILLQLYNTTNQSYTQYSYLYRATDNKTKLMFCFINQYNFWGLDDVSMKDSQTNTNIITNGDFETNNWPPWTYYCSAYYGSGMSSGYSSLSAHGGSYFYLDMQYNKTGDGIFQNLTTVAGRNYTISFYLANPLGGSFSVAIVSVGP